MSLSTTLELLHVGCEEVSAGKPGGVRGEQELGVGNPNCRGGVHGLDGVLDQAAVVETLFLLAGDKAPGPGFVSVDAHTVLPGDALDCETHGGCGVPSGGVGCVGSTKLMERALLVESHENLVGCFCSSLFSPVTI